MKCAILIGVFVALTVLAIDATNSTATSKPFVRSRYSRRWRVALTTESNVSNNTLTTEAQKAVLLTEIPLATTTTTGSKVTSVHIEETTVGSATVPPSSTYSALKSTPKATNGSHGTTTEHPTHSGTNGLPLDYDYYGNGGENEEEAAHK